MTNHDESQLYQELEWIFTSMTYAGHTGVKVIDGKVVSTKYIEKIKCSTCLTCDAIRKLKKEVLAKLKEHENNTVTNEVKK